MPFVPEIIKKKLAFLKKNLKVTIIFKHKKYFLSHKISNIQLNIYVTEQNESKKFLFKKSIKFYQIYWELKNL